MWRGLLAVATLALASATPACPLALPTLPVSVAGHPLTAELAATPEAQNCGLSHRAALAADRGMLFAFERPVHIAFWMKDTRIPLSIAFLDVDGRILAITDMAPLDSRRLHRPPRPYRYALEVNRGWFTRHGIGVGDRVRFELPASPGNL